MKLISPNEIIAAGIEMQLDGKKPTTREESCSLMNFIAANVQLGLTPSVCRLMKTIYPEYFGVLTDSEVEQIAVFQDERK
jgi:hypothetical protein